MTAAGPGPGSAALRGAAGSGAASGVGGGLSAWWGQVSAKAVEGQRAAAAAIRSRAGKGMPVDVKVDFINPTLDTIRDTASVAWRALPQQAQAAAPFVGAAAGSALLVFAVQQRRVAFQRARAEEARAQVVVLRRDNAELAKRVALLKARSGGPRTDVEARMAAAVAEATNAAAAAADAAARAATACIFQRPLGAGGKAAPQWPAGP
jgi:hypothetical protein